METTRNVMIRHGQRLAQFPNDDAGQVRVIAERLARLPENLDHVEDVKATAVTVELENYNPDEPSRNTITLYGRDAVRQLAHELIKAADLLDGHWYIDPAVEEVPSDAH